MWSIADAACLSVVGVQLWILLAVSVRADLRALGSDQEVRECGLPAE
jgi:hypothetical protein